jgi:hypothetical protein
MIYGVFVRHSDSIEQLFQYYNHKLMMTYRVYRLTFSSDFTYFQCFNNVYPKRGEEMPFPCFTISIYRKWISIMGSYLLYIILVWRNHINAIDARRVVRHYFQDVRKRHNSRPVVSQASTSPIHNCMLVELCSFSTLQLRCDFRLGKLNGSLSRIFAWEVCSHIWIPLAPPCMMNLIEV